MLDAQPHWAPDYTGLLKWRQAQIVRLARDPKLLAAAKIYYSTRPGEFINHWCDTFDTRNATTPNTMVRMPFIMFKRQRELIEFFCACLEAQASGVVEKSRDMGATWSACAFSVWVWLFIPGGDVGWGSRKQELVDKLGVMDSIFEKIRSLLRGLPPLFLPQGFNEKEHLLFMRVINPKSSSNITGESGPDIGRGGRKLLYFVDEAAHLEHPESTEAALMNNTNTQIDISSVNGFNIFHRKRESGLDWEPGQPAVKGRTNVFVLDWRDHPHKDQAWYDMMKAEKMDAGLGHLFYQEVDRNYAASVEGIIIQPEWIEAAIDAHLKLKMPEMEEGGWLAALDVADGGTDTNALVRRKGWVLKYADQWGARDVGVTARKTIQHMRGFPKSKLFYDAVGLGSAVKAEVNRLKDSEDATIRDIFKHLTIVPWDAGAAALWPEKRVVPNDPKSMLNKDFYANLKAQGWWQLGLRFERTWRAVTQGAKFKPDQLISIDSKIPLLQTMRKELSQPVRGQSARLKMLVEKTPEGMKSPNVGDATMMCCWPSDQSSYDSSLGWVG